MLHNKCHLINRMLENTKEYCDYANEAEFVKFVDKSLRNDMIFCCKRLVLTKDVVLGRIDNEREFLPVAILRSEVQSDSFYIEKRKYHRSNTPGYIHMYGILELRLKNGNVVKIHTSEGCGNDRVRQLLTGNKG